VLVKICRRQTSSGNKSTDQTNAGDDDEVVKFVRTDLNEPIMLMMIVVFVSISN
jgi:hypothetical protein